jgi:acyl-CoA reductase-like NAD-dependent aldehyde dehydrogenase
MVSKNYVNGNWLGFAAEPIVNVNPSDLHDEVGVRSAANRAQAELAINSAREAFADWSRRSIQMRFELLDRVGGQILARANEIGRLLAREEGNLKSNARIGLAMINTPTAGVDYHVPFGGVKDSSYGWREQGTSAIEFFTRSKTVYTPRSGLP